MEERSKLQKIVLTALAAMAVVFAQLTLILHTQKGAVFEGGFLRLSDGSAVTAYTGKIRGEQIEITVDRAAGENLTEVVFQIGDRIRDVCTLETGLPPIQAEQLGPVEHIRITKNDRLLFEGGYDPDHDYGWYDLDGSWNPFSVSVTGRPSSDDYWKYYATDTETIRRFAQGPRLVYRGSWALYFIMLMFTAVLALDVAYPLVIFRCQHMCDVRDPEPSDFYLATQRIGWCVYPLLLLIGYIYALCQLP